MKVLIISKIDKNSLKMQVCHSQWYMFDITDKLKNYGLQQTNYNITTPLTKHMK